MRIRVLANVVPKRLMLYGVLMQDRCKLGFLSDQNRLSAALHPEFA